MRPSQTFSKIFLALIHATMSWSSAKKILPKICDRRTHARTDGRTDKAIPRARLPSLKIKIRRFYIPRLTIFSFILLNLMLIRLILKSKSKIMSKGHMLPLSELKIQNAKLVKILFQSLIFKVDCLSCIEAVQKLLFQSMRVLPLTVMN